MPGKIDENSIVDDAAGLGLADDRSLHPVVEDLPRNAADCLEGGGMTAQNRREILVDDKRAQIRCEKPRAMENNQTIRGAVGSSVKTTWT